MKLTTTEMQEIVAAITYKPNWKIHFKSDGDDNYVQIEATTLDSITRSGCVDRKWWAWYSLR